LPAGWARGTVGWLAARREDPAWTAERPRDPETLVVPGADRLGDNWPAGG
jgi:hypothetical protein